MERVGTLFCICQLKVPTRKLVFQRFGPSWRSCSWWTYFRSGFYNFWKVYFGPYLQSIDNFPQLRPIYSAHEAGRYVRTAPDTSCNSWPSVSSPYHNSSSPNRYTYFSWCAHLRLRHFLCDFDAPLIFLGSILFAILDSKVEKLPCFHLPRSDFTNLA